ncbi:hypothetical protein OEZ85_004362 [Tetradesmus obliquus]|uniref:phosphoribosylaminoimidazolesuccinocarboxamide synthase n=2 Tax=Tetradesmus obliquus TaxID=3088 RepID=A0ABY8UR28_TETOB|nr:hypothetical protein OEZ85_004362 [Tetradesmus obliquus]
MQSCLQRQQQRLQASHMAAPHPRIRPSLACRAAASASVESIQGVRPEIKEAIAAAVNNCVTETNLPLPNKRVGKVRDTYELDDKIVIVTTDRQSAFDRLLASIPFKGQVLNQTAAWWFAHTGHIIGNAVLDVPDPNITVMKKCTVFPVEFVVRGFMTGSTDTSLWTHYSNGAREYCGNSFPDGMAKNARLAANVITPTTKSETHDVPISPAEIVAQGLMSQADWDTASSAALALFAHGQAEAAQRGLLLVDTKYELGKDAEGNILLLDEIHTPDSSRYWLADSYESRHAAGQEAQNIDKEFLRLWFRSRCDPYKDEVLPEAPVELVSELSARYVYLYERITGQDFVPPPLQQPVGERMLANMAKYL